MVALRVTAPYERSQILMVFVTHHSLNALNICALLRILYGTEVNSRFY